MRLHVHSWGSGPAVVLIHGGVLGGRQAWRAQRPLSERWTLLAPDRPGHGLSPDARQDFETESGLVADQLLGGPVHLVGYSYGGIVAMLAAAQRPQGVRTLTVVEPPATRVAHGVAAADRLGAELTEIFESPADDLGTLLARFFEAAGVPFAVPDPLPEPLERGARALIGARPPGEAQLPLETLAAGPFPMLVVSGGHMEGYEAVCDTIAARTGAERVVIEGGAHLVPDTGEPFNERLESFIAGAVR